MRFCVLLVLFCRGRALLRADPSVVGQRVGGLLRKMDDSIAVDTARGGDSKLQSAIIGALGEKDEVLVNPGVSEAVAKANSLAAHKTVDEDPVCVRDYSAHCPDGWHRIGSKCVAPRSYTGACRHIQAFAQASDVEKYNFADLCKAPWPCADQCGVQGHEYDGCPEGWKDTGGGFCETSQESLASCMGMYKFDDMSVADKQELTASCGIEWKCKTSCAQDFGAACPEGWADVAGLCAAPASYAGDCEFSVNTTSMTAMQKSAYAEKCSVEFPCGEPNGRTADTATSGVGTLDGPIDYASGRVLGEGNRVKQDEHVTTEERFGRRFVVPSGPLDSRGDTVF